MFQLPAVLWGINVLFVLLIVAVVFMAHGFIVRPPQSWAEGVFEAHKVVVVGTVTLAGVGIVEIVALAFRLHAPDQQVFVLLVVAVLLGDAILGLGLFTAALAYDGQVRAHRRMDRSSYLQVAFGLALFAVASYVVFKCKCIDVGSSM
jgi:uncharacterized membrane protein YidH (DUF202 family)